jgi:hypothetical protein
MDDPLPDGQVRAARQDLFRQLETLVLANEDPAVVLEILMPEKAAGRDATVVRIFRDEDCDVMLWLDTKTGLPIRLQYPRVKPKGLGEIVEDVYDDYRIVNGLRAPFRIVTSTDGQPYMETMVVTVAYNTGLKARELAEFEAPSSR